MKKILCLLLVVCMTTSLIACDNAANQTEQPATLPTEEVVEPIKGPSVEEVPVQGEENSETAADVETLVVEDSSNSTAETEFAEDVLSGLVTNMTFTYTVYSPNENADGFIEEVVEVNEVNPVSILWELKQRNPVLENVEINYCSLDDEFFTIDFNQAFADVVCSMGTSGELMVVGSVVNTYLSALHIDSMYFTVEGEVLESGHTVYDFVMSYFSMNN